MERTPALTVVRVGLGYAEWYRPSLRESTPVDRTVGGTPPRQRGFLCWDDERENGGVSPVRTLKMIHPSFCAGAACVPLGHKVGERSPTPQLQDGDGPAVQGQR